MHAARDEGARLEAVDCAKAAAPYVHSKLAPTSPPAPVHDEVDYTVLSDTEFDPLEKLYSKVLNPAGRRNTAGAISRETRTLSPLGFVGRGVKHSGQRSAGSHRPSVRVSCLVPLQL
jgi:hypothetical protein